MGESISINSIADEKARARDSGLKTKPIPERHRVALKALGNADERRAYVLRNLNRLAPIRLAKPEDFSNWYDSDNSCVAWYWRLNLYVTSGGHDYEKWANQRSASARAVGS